MPGIHASIEGQVEDVRGGTSRDKPAFALAGHDDDQSHPPWVRKLTAR
jgi:hypothetical protein